MACVLSTNQVKVIAREVANKVGENVEQQSTLLGLIVDKEGNWNTSFKDWVGDEMFLNLDSIKTISKETAKKLVEFAWQYLKEIKPDIDSSAREESRNPQVSIYGYTSVLSRERGKKHMGTFILDIYNELQNRGLEMPEDARSYFKDKLRDKYRNFVLQHIAAKSNKSISVIREAYSNAEDKHKFIIDSVLESDGSITGENIIALYKELNSLRNSDNYIEEIFYQPFVAAIYSEINKDTVAESDKKAEEEANQEEKDGEEKLVTANDLDTDDTIANYGNHIGIYSSFASHLGIRVKNYFNSLRRLKSNTKEDYEIDSFYGFPETMDANLCSAILYNSGEFYNIKTMIASIENIAKTIPGFECFAKFAEDLKQNTDFATEVFTTFSKTKIRRIETALENGEVKTKVTNPYREAEAAMLNEMFTEINHTSQLHNDAVFSAQLNDIHDEFYKAKSRKQMEDAEDRLKRIFKAYFPSVQEKAITSYIDTHNNATTLNDRKKNATRLTKALLGVVNNCPKAKVARNKQIDEINKQQDIIAQKEANHFWVSDEDRDKLREAQNINYTGELAGDIRRLSQELVGHSVVNTQLNSRNVYGNNTSDIINSSWITRFNDILSKTTKETVGLKEVLRNRTLEKWGERKLRSTQYKYSNILLERKDENGKILTRGLFQYVDDGSGNQILVLTDYADELLKVALVNGANNNDGSKSVSYSDMNRPDFVPTSFMQFFKTEDREISNSDAIGTYFLRTPSDATNIFAIQAPKYDTTGLVILENENEINTEANRLAIEKVQFIHYDEQLPELGPAVVANMSKIVDGWLLTYANPPKIKSGKYTQLIIDNEKAIEYITDEEGNKTEDAEVTFYERESGVILRLKGTVRPAGNKKALRNAELVGIYDKKLSEGIDNNGRAVPQIVNQNSNDINVQGIVKSYRDYFYNEIKKGNTEGITDVVPRYTVDKNNFVFAAVKNQFKQEMLNAAQAIAHYFKLTNFEGGKQNEFVVKINPATGLPSFILEEDEVAPTEELKKRIDEANKKGYAFYHLGEHGQVFYDKKTEVGTVRRLDGGAVFGSSKFTLVHEETDNEGNVTVSKKNYFDGIINNAVPGETDADGNSIINDSSINFLYGRSIRIIGSQVNGSFNVEDISFTEELDEAVNNALTSFILDNISYTQNKLLEYQDFIHDVKVNDDTCTQFAINQFLTFCMYDELFEGDTKFYKDSQTVLKRAKEYEASGVPYGITDIWFEHEDNLKDVTDYSYLNNGIVYEEQYDDVVDEKGNTKKQLRTKENGEVDYKETKIQDFFDGTIFKGVRQRNGFKAVTIKNSKQTNEVVLERLVKALVEQSGVDEKQARNLLYGPESYNEETGKMERKGGFTDSKVNDAQSYITIQEWVRRIAARGQLQRHMPLIKKLCDPNAILTASDLKQFVQVQKNIYYDLHYDERYGIEVPRQIKNAEFVLVPQLIKGTELETVYNLMIENGIDQLNTVETSKAANEELLTLWDNDGNLSEQSINTFREKTKHDGIKQVYSYNFLYTQQETPQHMNAENKAGIQIVKKIMDNVPDNNPFKQQFFDLYAANIQESFENTLRKFEIPLDENGNILLDENNHVKDINLKVFFERLKEEMMRTGMDSNLADYVTIEDGEDRPVMPTCMNNIFTKFEQVVQSMFNSSITRQKLPGFHAPQVTNIGWGSMAEDLPNFSRNNLENNSYWKDFVKVTDSSKISWKDNKLSDSTKKEFSDWLKYNTPTYARKLEYHPTVNGVVQPYIEVMVPASYLGIDRNSSYWKGKTDDQILKEIQEKKLDTFIGYRIPTEGKQSICIMKVAGILSDAYGSTIVVPNEWVAQTGSDFDVDSVYTIQYETTKRKNGDIIKIGYKDKNATFTENDYINYVDRNTKQYDLKDASENRKNQNSKLNKSLNKRIKELEEEENKLFALLDPMIRKKVIETYDYIGKRQAKDKKEGTKTRTELHKEKLTSLINSLEKYKVALSNVKGLPETIIEGLEKFIDKNKELLEAVDNKHENLKEIEECAKEYGLMSYKEFVDPKNRAKANSRKARNSGILDAMIGILSDPKSLEENLSRSNFDDITYWKNKLMSKNARNERKARSAYNWYDQACFQEDAMSGAKLKAASVTLDTFCSVCNTVRPNLGIPVRVVYNSADFENPNDVKERYNVDETATTFVINHDQYGWSKDNKNTEGRILTAYSSQTTAYILDAIKEGSLPNVNMYTFNVFKLFPNLGCDYRTALSFIMQPAIAQIVKNNNSNNSIFSRTHDNPINKAIRDLATELGIECKRSTPIATVLKKVNEVYNTQFNKLFAIEGEKPLTIAATQGATSKIPIHVDKLIKRINEEGEFNTKTPVERNSRGKETKRAITAAQKRNEENRINKLLFDLGTVLTFSNLHTIAYEIGSIARCCNPDKFGAKQTVYATRKVFSDIDEAIFGDKTNMFAETDGSVGSEERKPILSKDGKHILESIYPGCAIDNGTPDDIIKNIVQNGKVEDSSYRSLFSFLKYASATSTIIAKTLFETEHENFVAAVEGFSNVLNGKKKRLTDEQYTDVKRYMLGALYNDAPAIKYPVSVEVVTNEDGTKTTKLNLVHDKNVTDRQAVENEKERIYGYGHYSSLKVKVNRTTYKTGENGNEILDENGNRIVEESKDYLEEVKIKNLKNPTKEEIEMFERFSPAQKVDFIRTYFNNTGIFAYITPVLHNNASRGIRFNMQTLEFNDEKLDSNTIYSMFKTAMFNNNPLIVSAAIDIVKYGVQVEGLKMTKRAVYKVIDNDAFINSMDEGGMDFVSHMRNVFNYATTQGIHFDGITIPQVYENYLRSHPETAGIKTIYLNDTTKKDYKLSSQVASMYSVSVDTTISDEDEREEDYTSRLESMGIIYKSGKEWMYNDYIRIKEGKYNNTLYKVYHDYNNPNMVFLYPLGKLMPFECSKWSVNEVYNKDIYSSEAYAAMCPLLMQKAIDNQWTTADWTATNLADVINEKGTGELYISRRISDRNVDAIPFNIEDVAELNPGSSIDIALSLIKQWFGNAANRAYDKNGNLTDSFQQFFIFNSGSENSLASLIPSDNIQSRQTITINGVKREFVIRRIKNRSKNAEAIFGHGSEIADKYISEAKNASYRDVLRTCKRMNKNMYDVFVVQEVSPAPNKNDNRAFDAKVEELNSAQIDFAITQRASYNEESSLDVLEKFRVHGVNQNQKVIGGKLEYVNRELAAYATKFADYLTTELCEKFYREPGATEEEHETYISITDPRVLNLIKNDAKLQDRYLHAINAAKAFIETFGNTEDVEYNSEDADIKRYLDKMQKAVDKVKKLPLDKLNRDFAQVMGDKLSTNPLIKEQFIDVCDAYWRTEGFMWHFSDIMDNGTPLLQIMMKDIMADIDAKEKHKEKVLATFWKEVNRIKEAAKREGLDIDFTKIIDEHGRFQRKYTEEFANKLDELREAKEAALLDPAHGQGSIKHLKAQLEYDEFKAKHINQEARVEYYLKKIDLEKRMLYGEDMEVYNEEGELVTVHIPPFAELYSEYMKLKFRMYEIYSHQSADGLSVEDIHELETIRYDIANLTGNHWGGNDSYTKGDVTYPRKHYNPIEETYTPEEEAELKLYSFEAQQALARFEAEMNGLNERYFESSAAFGFEEELQRNLDIVIAAEHRDAMGIPQRSQTELDYDETYQKAKDWLRKNARYQVILNEDDAVDPASLGARLLRAVNDLHYGKNGKPNEINKIMREAEVGNDIHDEKGIPDGRLLTEDERKRIKQLQERAYGLEGTAPFSDRKLISNARPSDVPLFKPEFYKAMGTTAEKHPEYYAAVTKINQIFYQYYNADDGIIHIEKIPVTEEGISQLEELAAAYETMRKYSSGNADFIRENVDFKTNNILFAHQREEIKRNTILPTDLNNRYREAMQHVFLDKKADGSFVIDGGSYVPNRYLYGYAVPKGEPGTENYDKWVDDGTRAENIKLINECYRKVPTIYYEKEKGKLLKEVDRIYREASSAEEGSRLAREYYAKWYEENHIYNPYTRAMEPIACWVKNELRYELFENGAEGKWLPKGKEVDRKVRDGHEREYYGIGADEYFESYDRDKDMRNHDYIPDASLLENYHPHDPLYDNNLDELNRYEKEMSDYLQKVLKETANVDKAQKFFRKGYAPRLAKAEDSKSDILIELGKMFGINGFKKAKDTEWSKNVGYEHDFVVDPPMTKLLEDKRSTPYKEQQAQAYRNIHNIGDMVFGSEEEKENYRKEQEAIIADCKKHLNEISESLMNRDWPTVIAEYLSQINRYNAILDNKNKIYYLHNMLRNMKMMVRNPITGSYEIDKRRGDEDNPVYVQQTDKDLITQYETFIRRLVFDQWKEKSNWNTFGANLQNFTSANYMMLNIRGGIANVTLGVSGILGEAAASEAIGAKAWAWGNNEYRKGIISYGQRGYAMLTGQGDKHYSKQDAVIEYFNVVEYDEYRGVARDTNLKEYSEKLRNMMFSPQTMGEHYMQNTVLLGMLHSHKLVTDETGEVTFMNEGQYIQMKLEQGLNDILTEEQQLRFRRFKDEIKKDERKKKKYVEFRRNLLTEFMYFECTKEQQDKFKEMRKQQIENAKREFAEKVDMYSQMELSSDGKFKFVDGSLLAQLDEQLYQVGSPITKAERLCAEFAEKVRKTNNRIHGNYNKLGQADIEKYWWGSLVMQYHKHIPMGILKRYLRRGHWDETRGTVFKGMLASVHDMLNLNWRKIKAEAGLTDEEIGACQSFVFMLTHTVDYLKQLSATWAIMPEYDRANIWRNVGDAIGVLSAMATVAALWYIADDDEEMQDSIAFNLMLYEADRLASEAFMWNPYGLAVEGKKLMSTPVAAQSIITDGINTGRAIINWMLDDEYDPYYHSGRFAGKHKMSIWIQRRIPIWNGIRGILDTPGNNHYYKLGQNPIGLFNVKEWVTGDEG